MRFYCASVEGGGEVQHHNRRRATCTLTFRVMIVKPVGEQQKTNFCDLNQ